jgi:mycofactocin system glycosyltransferase
VARLSRLALDRSVRRAGGGRVLVAGSPLILLRLTDAGAALIDRIESAGPSGAEISGGSITEALVDRLLDAGVVHPVPHEARISLSDVTVVIPAFGTAHADLDVLVRECTGVAEVIIVDDASPSAVAPVPGARVVRRDPNGGPGQARMTGLDLVATPFVAFVDTDVTLHEGWLAGLLGHLDDDRVALVAPRVASLPGSDLLARYETVRSPLDLGSEPARVRAGTRVSYVPSAVVVGSVAALRSVGGFDDSMRVGEDVDIVWRLDEAGWRIRYEPAVTVHHAPRASTAAWLDQRYRYGTSAASLEARHPGALAPVRVSAWSAISWLAAAAGWPVIGGAVASVTTALLMRKLRAIPDGRRLALRLAGLGHLYAGRSLAAGCTRAWWPLTFIVALASRRARRAAVLAAVVPPLVDWWTTRPPMHAPTYVALRNLDDVAYGAGLWTGAIRARSFGAIRPDLTSWPKPARRAAAEQRRPDDR